MGGSHLSKNENTLGQKGAREAITYGLKGLLGGHREICEQPVSAISELSPIYVQK